MKINFDFKKLLLTLSNQTGYYNGLSLSQPIVLSFCTVKFFTSIGCFVAAKHPIFFVLTANMYFNFKINKQFKFFVWNLEKLFYICI